MRRSKLHYTASGIITPIGGRLVHGLREDDTRGCVMQFCPPEDEHVCSKHVEAWNKLIVKQKFSASSLLITEINILRCTVSKTSKKKVGFYSKNKFENLVQLVGFIIRIYHDAWSAECQKKRYYRVRGTCYLYFQHSLYIILCCHNFVQSRWTIISFINLTWVNNIKSA